MEGLLLQLLGPGLVVVGKGGGVGSGVFGCLNFRAWERRVCLRSEGAFAALVGLDARTVVAEQVSVGLVMLAA